ncbi:hypothetical protein BWQ95_21350 [Aeromonas hydrophila]|nr:MULTISPECIES: DUF2971 domain-containing protein [Aeromonas]GKQ61309.1 hypothetical protein KAM338_14860 [Aeromonas caviae]HDT5860682.1 DUF2971 domain-containing protein [Aeromonas hydrophila subsp. hydrophila]MCO4114969.1 DUF2971 domain-containing protein [Aeromonas hydrophila]MCV9383024.1 DUF2971 domain-containing protein [Aeromonas hydrophila]MDD9225456.1 DUF2971 domain-containing protein [Aeromonas hydrophila]
MKKEIFYKYRAMNTNLIESLCWDKIFYASPATFNDPLDCKMFSIENNSSIEELRKIYARLKFPRTLKNAEKNIRGKDIEAKIKPLLEEMAKSIVIDNLNRMSYNSTDPEYTCTPEDAETGILTSNILSELREHYSRGVFCFSKDGKNMLMWSHYGDEHKGICIGYSNDRKPTPNIRPVIYGKYGVIKTSSLYKAFVKNDKDEQTTIENEILLKKSSAWRYEKEYRLISSTGLQDSPLKLEEITFGLRCPDEVRHTIIKMMEGRRQEIKYYEMVLTHKSANLIKSPYNGNSEWSINFPQVARSAVEIFGETDIDC